jgi:hypothetical protein
VINISCFQGGGILFIWLSLTGNNLFLLTKAPNSEAFHSKQPKKENKKKKCS